MKYQYVSVAYSLIGTIVVAISLGYILYRQNKADKDDKN